MSGESKLLLLTRDQIMAAQDMVFEIVDVPEWGGAVRIRSLNGLERDAFEAAIAAPQQSGKVKFNTTNMRARLCAMSICDESGQRLFKDSDVMELGKRSAAALDRVFSAAQRLSGLSKKDIDELTENLE